MIVFSCPSCDTEFEVSDGKGGTRITCDECGHRFQIPAAKKESADKVTAKRPAAKAPVVTAKAKRGRRDEDYEDEDEVEVEDRPKSKKKAPEKKSNSTMILVAVGGLAAACIAGLVIFLMTRSGDKDNKKKVADNKTPPGDKKSDDKKDPPKDADKKDSKDSKDNKTGDTKKGGDDEKEDAERPVRVTGNDIYQHVLKSTAWVVVKRKEGVATGTGSLIDKKNRLVLTNHHVVRGQESIAVFFPVYQNGKLVAERDAYLDKIKNKAIDVIRAQLVSEDKVRDLALIQLDRLPKEILPLGVAKQSVQQGDKVHSLGNPGSSGGLWVYTSGTVRQVYKKKWKAGGSDFVLDLEARVVETQSPTNPGDSGGPLVNGDGELVGVTQGGDIKAQLVSVFIDVSEATDFVEKYCKSANLVWNREKRALVVHNSAAVPDLIKRLGSKKSRSRGRAAQDLAILGSAAKMAVPALVRLLKDPDEVNRRLAQDALTKIGVPDKADAAALADYLKDADLRVRTYAAEALGKIGPEARAVAPALLLALKDKDPTVRRNAARSLGRVGSGEKSKAVAALNVLLKDEDQGVRVAAAEALTTVAPLGANDLGRLRELLKHQDSGARAAATRGLGLLRFSAKEVVPLLIQAFKDNPDKDVRLAAVGSLARFGAQAKEAVPVLIEAMKDDELRRLTVLALASIGPDAKAAVKALADALLDGDKDTRTFSLVALGRFGPAAKEAVPNLVTLLGEKDRTLRFQVLGVLSLIGPDAKAAVPDLIKLFDTKDKALHTRVAAALAKIGKPAVVKLVVALNDDNAYIRLGAANALGGIGPDARGSYNYLLVHAQRDPIAEVRKAAEDALSKVAAKGSKKPKKKKKKSPTKQ
jgi:HEAT repeat protein